MWYAVNINLMSPFVDKFFGVFVSFVLPTVCLILFLVNRKKLSNYQFLITILILFIESFLFVRQTLQMVKVSNSSSLLILWLHFSGLVVMLYGFKLMVQQNILGSIRAFINTAILLVVIGLFEQSWWTLIPLTAAVLLFVFSKEWFMIVSNIEITEEDIPFYLKKKWGNARFKILMTSLLLYPTITFSDILEEFDVLRWMRIVFFKKVDNGDISPFERFFFKGFIRLIVFGCLFFLILLIYLMRNKSKYYREFSSDYEKVIKTKIDKKTLKDNSKSEKL